MNPKFAHKFIEKELLGTYVMIRGYKDPKYWTSEQLKIDQPEITGFLSVNQVAELALTTKWTSYKIFQATNSNDLEYLKPHYLKAETTLEKALEYFISNHVEFAVVRDYKKSKELGMISEQAVRDLLSQMPNSNYAEEVKVDENGFDRLQAKLAAARAREMARNFNPCNG